MHIINPIFQLGRILRASSIIICPCAIVTDRRQPYYVISVFANIVSKIVKGNMSDSFELLRILEGTDDVEEFSEYSDTIPEEDLEVSVCNFLMN